MIEQIQTILLDWGKLHFQEFPWRNPAQQWHGLIAELLLQRTRAKNVIPVYLDFIRQFPEPALLTLATVEAIEKVIYPLGLRWRAPLLKALGEALVKNGNKVPENKTDLLNLPGVGPYAAAAYLSFHEEKRCSIIDANIVRLVGRLTGCPIDAETRRKKWLIEYIEALTPHHSVRNFNYALLDFTMEICSLSPKCDLCPLGAKYCTFRRRILQESRNHESL